MILNLDDALAARDSGLTWEELSARLPRNDLPKLLWHCASDWDYDFPDCSFSAALADAWQAADSPEDSVGRRFWIEHLREIGYVTNGVVAPAPTVAITVYRGGTEPRRMAWTMDRETAALFASGLGGRTPAGRFWTATAPARAQLMAFDGSWGRIGETEIVVDPELLVDVRETGGPMNR